MTYSTHTVTAGLAFMGTQPLDIIRIGNRAGAMLDWLDQPVLKMCTLSDTEICLQTDGFDLTIQIETDRNLPTLDRRAAQFLSLGLNPVGTDDPPEDRLLLSVVAHLLRVLHGKLSPDYVQWVHPLALLSHAEFLAAITPQNPASVQPDPLHDETPQADAAAPQPTRSRLPDIEATNQLLQDRLGRDHAGVTAGAPEPTADLRLVFRDDAQTAPGSGPSDTSIREDSDTLRLAVWMMTITLAIFALPVAASLAVVNLFRGENLRLASQTAALTGLFMSLHVTGATALALQTVQSLL